MDDFRSRSMNGDEKTEMEACGSRVAPSSSDPYAFRCYSTSQIPSNHSKTQAFPKEMKLKKGKSTSGSSSSSSKGGWILSDPELKRKKRVAGYKSFALEGKMKGSLRNSFRWIKDRCSQVVYGKWIVFACQGTYRFNSTGRMPEIRKEPCTLI